MANNNMIQITGLWKNTSQKGESYLTGYFGNAKVLIFKNSFKDKDNQPDYKLYISAKKQPGDDGLGDDFVVETAPHKRKSGTDDSNEVPF